jgi:signal recognition particle receptor subunit beta
LVEINHKERFLRIKILYYGPAAGGKTTSLQVLHRHARSDRRQELVSVNTAQDRTILFDLLPLSTPAFRSYELRFQVVAVPGQKFYGATRKMLLKNADSIVFVANSATDRWQENLQSMKEMTEYLLDHGIEPSSIPMVFQYNKRDLPDITDIKIMERGMNARGAPSFESVATEGRGVLESFGAILERTMTELATRYKIGENFGDARSAKEWASRTMLEVFGTTLEQLQRSKEPPYPPAEPAPTRVVRVAAPKLSAVSPSDSAFQTPPPAAGPAPPVHSPPPGALQLDTKSANAMVESYAEAASSLADHISELNEQTQLESRKVSTYRAVADVAKKLFSATPDETPVLLEGLVGSLAQSLRCGQASLSLLRPDGHFEQIVGFGLPVDPLEGAKSPGGRPLAQAIVDGQKPMLQVRGEAGVLEEAMDRAALDCVAVLALPMRTPVHAVGLLTFYLPQEAPAPNQETIEHLERVALELTMVLEVISSAHAADSLKHSLRSSFRGRVAEGAAYGLDVPLGGIDAALVRMRARNDAPAWVHHELMQVEASVSNVKFMRQTLLDLRGGRLPARVPTPINELLARLENELGPALTEQGIRFIVEIKPGVRPVYAEPYLLRGLLYTVIDNSRRRLAGAGGGVIRILVQPDTHGARISIFDNLIAVSNALSAPARFLSWPLERRLTEVTNELMQSVVEYFQGRWAEETREAVGTVRTIVLPTA